MRTALAGLLLSCGLVAALLGMLRAQGFDPPVITRVQECLPPGCTIPLVVGEARTFIQVRPDGNVVISPGANLDEASLAFWDAVRKMGLKLACGDGR